MTIDTPTPRRKQYTKAKEKAKAPHTPMTLEQLRSYLKGIQFVGGEGWHPDQKQWEAIVRLIDTLIPDQVQVEAEPLYTPYPPHQTLHTQVGGWSEPAQIPRIQDIPGGGFTMTPPVPSTPDDGAPYRSEYV